MSMFLSLSRSLPSPLSKISERVQGLKHTHTHTHSLSGSHAPFSLPPRGRLLLRRHFTTLGSSISTFFPKPVSTAKDVMSRGPSHPHSPSLPPRQAQLMGHGILPTGQGPALDSSPGPSPSLGPSNLLGKRKISCVRDGQGGQDTQKRPGGQQDKQRLTAPLDPENITKNFIPHCGITTALVGPHGQRAQRGGEEKMGGFGGEDRKCAR